MEDTSVGLEEVLQDEQICSEDRGHIVKLKNMSLQQLYDMAYQAGFEDGMSFILMPSVTPGSLPN